MHMIKIRQVKALLLLTFLAVISGCGGGGGGGVAGAVPVNNGTTGGFTVAGKVTLADGTPLSGVSVNIYKTTYSIYSTTGLYGANSISTSVTPSATLLTSADGSYAFKNILSGNYTITPKSPFYLFKWKQVPTKDSIGVLTLTDSLLAYVFNPDGSIGFLNKLSPDRTIIYNTTEPVPFTNNMLKEQDFEGAVPGGGSGGL